MITEMEVELDIGVKWKCAASHDCNSTVEQFWYAVDIYNKRPHIINRKLIGAEILLTFHLDDRSRVKSVLSLLRHLEKSSSCDIIQSLQNVEGLEILNSENCDHCDLHFTLRNLLPRNNDNFLPQLELTILGKRGSASDEHMCIVFYKTHVLHV